VSGTDQPVLKFLIPFKAWIKDDLLRFEPARLAASVNTIAAVHECCV